MHIIFELLEFIKIRKKFWLLPVITVLLCLGLLILMTSGTAVAPFVYALF